MTDTVRIKGWTFEIKEVKSVTTYPNENDIYIEFLDENNQYHYVKARIDQAVVNYQGHVYGAKKRVCVACRQEFNTPHAIQDHCYTCGLRKCTDCGEVKDVAEYPYRERTPDHCHDLCIACDTLTLENL